MHPSQIFVILIIISGLIHIIEEFSSGFVTFANKLLPGITNFHFWLINSLFMAYVTIALLSNKNLLILSIPFLLIINAILHVSGLVILRKYNPGVISAILLYIPISIAFIFNFKPSSIDIFKSVALSIFLMIIPFGFQLIRVWLAKIIIQNKNLK